MQRLKNFTQHWFKKIYIRKWLAFLKNINLHMHLVKWIISHTYDLFFHENIIHLYGPVCLELAILKITGITDIDDQGLLYGYFQLLYFRENVIHPPWLPLNNLWKVGEQIFIYMMAMSCLNKLSFFSSQPSTFQCYHLLKYGTTTTPKMINSYM